MQKKNWKLIKKIRFTFTICRAKRKRRTTLSKLRRWMHCECVADDNPENDIPSRGWLCVLMMWIWSWYCLYDEITAWRRRQCRLNLRKRKLPKKQTWRNAGFGMFLGTEQATTHNSQSHECAMNLNSSFLSRCLCFLRRRRPQKTQNDTIKSKTCLDWISFFVAAWGSPFIFAWTNVDFFSDELRSREIKFDVENHDEVISVTQMMKRLSVEGCLGRLTKAVLVKGVNLRWWCRRYVSRKDIRHDLPWDISRYSSWLPRAPLNHSRNPKRCPRKAFDRKSRIKRLLPKCQNEVFCSVWFPFRKIREKKVYSPYRIPGNDTKKLFFATPFTNNSFGLKKPSVVYFGVVKKEANKTLETFSKRLIIIFGSHGLKKGFLACFLCVACWQCQWPEGYLIFAGQRRHKQLIQSLCTK